MFICKECKAETLTGHFTYQGTFRCLKCSDFQDYLHFDQVWINEKEEIEIQSPLFGVPENKQRDIFIQLIHLIFNGKVNKAAYSLTKKYIEKGYSYLDLIRSMEYFYIIKKNPITKSNNNIGIIPYVAEKAKNYYNGVSKQRQKICESVLKTRSQENTKIEIEIETASTPKQIDMSKI